MGRHDVSDQWSEEDTRAAFAKFELDDRGQLRKGPFDMVLHRLGIECTQDQSAELWDSVRGTAKKVSFARFLAVLRQETAAVPDSEDGRSRMIQLRSRLKRWVRGTDAILAEFQPADDETNEADDPSLPADGAGAAARLPAIAASRPTDADYDWLGVREVVKAVAEAIAHDNLVLDEQGWVDLLTSLARALESGRSALLLAAVDAAGQCLGQEGARQLVTHAAAAADGVAQVVAALFSVIRQGRTRSVRASATQVLEALVADERLIRAFLPELLACLADPSAVKHKIGGPIALKLVASALSVAARDADAGCAAAVLASPLAASVPALRPSPAVARLVGVLRREVFAGEEAPAWVLAAARAKTSPPRTRRRRRRTMSSVRALKAAMKTKQDTAPVE